MWTDASLAISRESSTSLVTLLSVLCVALYTTQSHLGRVKDGSRSSCAPYDLTLALLENQASQFLAIKCCSAFSVLLRDDQGEYNVIWYFMHAYLCIAECLTLRSAREVVDIWPCSAISALLLQHWQRIVL